mgnify:CR=1 FL=1
MINYFKNLFQVKENFIAEFIIKFTFLLLIIFSIALTLLAFNKYSIFLDLLPFFISIIVIFVLLFTVLNKNKVGFKRNRIDYFVILFILVFCIFNTFHFSEIKIEGSRDQGVYFEAALLLAKNKSINPNNSIVGTYPGFNFYNGKIRFSFVPGYATFLSIFYTLFQFWGIRTVNSFLLFLSASIIYFLCKRLRNWQTGLFFLVFFLFNYYTIFFSRATYGENLQLLLMWFYVFLFVKGFQKKELSYMIYALFPLSITLFVRDEAFAYILIYLPVLLYFIFSKKLKLGKGDFSKVIISIFLSLAIIFSFYFVLEPGRPFFAKKIIQGVISHPFSGGLAWAPPPYNEQIFSLVSLFYMFTPSFILVFLLSIIDLLKENRENRKPILLITLLILPQFGFLYKPLIAFYLPWLMRRFWGIFIPYVFILFALFLTNPKKIIKARPKNVFMFFVTLIFLLSCLSSFFILFVTYGKGFINFEKEVALNFAQDDLVIFWGTYNYEMYGPPLYFLYDTNVVFDKLTPFDRRIYASFMKEHKDVYIATSQKPTSTNHHPYFKDNINYIKTINSTKMLFLKDTCDVRGYIFSPSTFRGYYQIEELCTKNNPAVEVSKSNINLNIYKLDPEFKEDFVKENYDPDYQLTRNTKNIWH